MREHIEILVVALSDVLHDRRTSVRSHAPAGGGRRIEPRRRRPRVARSTYVPVGRDLSGARLAH